MGDKVNIADLFRNLQTQMEVQLNTNREFILHAPSKGDSLENVWIEWLRKYLPNRYSVDKAFVIDSTGQLSDQLDLVIYDQQYTPFVFSQNGQYYIPAEGVYAVFEVKPDLAGNVGKDSYIAYAGKKIESVRALKRTSTNIIDRGKLHPPRPLTKIIGGILTSVCSYTEKKTIEKHLISLQGLATIDMGCSVEYGCFNIDYEGVEDITTQDFTERINSYYIKRVHKELIFSTRENSLVTFFLQLSRYLQQSIGTVAAIDFNAYAKNVNFTVDEEL